MKIVVIGGTGLIGGKVVEQLAERGHQAVAASRSTGVDLVTGAGLAPALEGAGIVIDVSNSGYSDPRDMQRFFRTAGARLLAAERAADIAHHVALSAIGSDRIDSGYFRAKRTQEELVEQGDVPFTIVRSAPFFEYIYNIVDAGEEGNVIRLPPVRMQPIAADDVARALANIALSQPANGVIELVGPDTLRLPALAEAILTANEDSRTIVTDADAPYFGARIDEEPLVGGDHPRFAHTAFEDWLRQSLIPARS